MAIIGSLVMLAMPKYLEYQKDARLTKIIVQATELEKASEKYYMIYQDWPRLSDEPYTSEQIADFGEKILNATGRVIELDVTGNYYDIDYSKISNYIKEPRDKNNYILQNPIGSIFYIENLTDIAKNRVPSNIGNKNELMYGDLSNYMGMIYVNAAIGDDLGGTGSQESPYRSITKAINSITLDNTAILITGGVYEETLVHIPLSYYGLGYSFVRTTPNKSYSLIGDIVNKPIINIVVPSHSTTYNSSIISLHDGLVDKEHKYELKNLIFRISDKTTNELIAISDLETDYSHTLEMSNIVIEQNPKVHAIFYTNGGSFGTTRNPKIIVNNSLLGGKSFNYSNGSHNISINNSVFIVQDKITVFRPPNKFIFNNVLFLDYPSFVLDSNYFTGTFFMGHTTFDGNYKVTNPEYKDLGVK